MRSTSSVYACVNWSLDLGAVDAFSVVYFSYLYSAHTLEHIGQRVRRLTALDQLYDADQSL